MLSIRKINPMIRAIGTIVAVAALVGGITYASGPGIEYTNTVNLTGNDISTAGGLMTIAAPTTVNNSPSCAGVTPSSTGQIPGLNVTNLAPGASSSPFYFCIGNTGSTALPVTMYVDSEPSSTIPTNDVILTLDCGIGGTETDTSDTLADINISSPEQIDNSLAGNSMDLCSATAQIDSTYAGPSGDVGTFQLDIQGIVNESEV